MFRCCDAQRTISPWPLALACAQSSSSRLIVTDRSRFGVTIHQLLESCQAGGSAVSLAMSSGNS